LEVVGATLEEGGTPREGDMLDDGGTLREGSTSDKGGTLEEGGTLGAISTTLAGARLFELPGALKLPHTDRVDKGASGGLECSGTKRVFPSTAEGIIIWDGSTDGLFNQRYSIIFIFPLRLWEISLQAKI
jgi:hypothetical protein